MITITTYPTYKHASKADFTGLTTVVIDLFRATSTITAALNHGCLDIIPVEKIGDGFAVRNAMQDKTRCILGGERGGVKLDGYDLGNSPLEYSGEVVADKHVVLCTTNGTQAIAKAFHSTGLYMGCLNNAQAVAKAALAAGEKIAILCSGSENRFSSDDVVTAGALIDRMLNLGAEPELDDLSSTALYLYRANKSCLKKFLTVTRPYQILTSIGAQDDIDYCIREDILDNVPVYRKGRIINL